ncbi:hypothetical protein CSV71_09490 [Sporosarcina sp. P21c]|uniref:sensor histidine kinase n=1 Tax=unclassified Sporosarcina TaxID=2647733 RepID=UPI000C165064|nr:MULTISPECIES: PAS domain-containing sensor histidine kinase [unclassified Sporosarcina]PIC66876.1 hypothetical protein CSV78_09795 [Sporosarcina sp. P16a]PIC84851.1 hypothetical protein CSV73_02855 [Sporosarcina sp. P1]PIC89377.1 hypothetical protein CSV71_09490 [Sporosarcina sp. P21c]PIC92328.1 hypothetical protein CSV70_10540 [Sporosarcina sp. P25]
MKNDVERVVKNPHLYTKDHIIHYVSNGFLELTGYEECDVVGKSLTDIDALLRSEHQISIQEIKATDYLYIFTSNNLPMEVEISIEIINKEDVKIYSFKEIKDSALKFTLDNFICTDTYKHGSVAIFSYPEGILLQHDENYIHTLSLMNMISENPLGKHPSFSNNIIDLLKQGISLHEFGVESISSNGVPTYWDINVKMICGDHNKYVLFSIYDVTDRTRERKLTTKQRGEMELLVSHTPDIARTVDRVDNMSTIIPGIDRDGRATDINKVGRQNLSQPIPEQVPDIHSVTSEMAYVKSEFFTTYFGCDGTPNYTGQGNVDSDIPIYKNIENIYKTKEYKALQENVEDISLYYASFSNKDFKITYINDYAFEIFKREIPEVHTELDVYGKSFFDFYKTDDVDELIKEIYKSIENKSSYTHKLSFCVDGTPHYTKTIFQPMFNQNNEVEKIIALGLDISDEELANKRMEKLLTAQEELFINTSHELKTPLSVIFSGAQLLNLYLENDSLEECRDDILNINKTTIGNCFRLIKLINNILDISKIESGLNELHLCNYNIVEIIDSIVQSVSEYTKSKDIQIIFDPDVEELFIALDVYKFDRILLNLISNAIKFSITGKVIFIKLEVTDYQTVRISVTDEGIGIAQESMGAIFGKFIQLNRNLNRISEGTGLGLPLAKSMAELHGGSLTVESILDKGSTFTIELPIKTIDTTTSNQEDTTDIDRVEIIKYEFSDIY